MNTTLFFHTIRFQNIWGFVVVILLFVFYFILWQLNKPLSILHRRNRLAVTEKNLLTVAVNFYGTTLKMQELFEHTNNFYSLCK